MHTECGIEKLNVDELPNSSFNIILGKRRSGKTILAESIVKQLFELGKVDCAFLFSPTDAGFDMISHENRFPDLEMLHTIVANHEKINDYNKIAPKKQQIKARTMIVLDDLACSLKDIKNRILESLAVLGRHKAYEPCSLSFLILAQSLTKIPKVCRLNCDTIFLAQLCSRLEQDLVFDENLYLLDGSCEGRKKARGLYDNLARSDDFIFVVLEVHRQNCTEFKHFIKTYKAEYSEKK